MLSLLNHSPAWRKPGQMLNQKPWWAAASFRLHVHGLLYSLVSYGTQVHQLRGTTVHSELGSPTVLSTDQSHGGIFATEVHSSQMTQASFKSTEASQLTIQPHMQAVPCVARAVASTNIYPSTSYFPTYPQSCFEATGLSWTYPK